MNHRTTGHALRYLTVRILAFIAFIALIPPASAQETNQTRPNVETVLRAFDAWAAGTGGPFDLLSDDARWTITGKSAVSGTYSSREAFLREVIRPFNARMKTPLKPSNRRVYIDGDTVIVQFDAHGIATDGVEYNNSYVWILVLKDGRIIESTAFFDSIAFDDLWQRVRPFA